MRTHVVADATMSSKVCPVCKTFSSSSNTTLNAHIDRCLSLGPMRKVTAGSKVIKHRTEPGKTRLMVDVYAEALRCTLEDLDRRNGTNWASTHRLEADLSARDKDDDGGKRNGPSSVCVDSTGTKGRISSKLKNLPSSGNSADGRSATNGGKKEKKDNPRQARDSLGKGSIELRLPSSAQSRKRRANSSFHSHDEHTDHPRSRTTTKEINDGSKKSDDRPTHPTDHKDRDKEDSSELKRLKDHRNDHTEARLSSYNGCKDTKNRPSANHHRSKRMGTKRSFLRKRKLCYVSSDSEDEAIEFQPKDGRKDDPFRISTECVSQHNVKKGSDLLAEAELPLQGGQESTIPMKSSNNNSLFEIADSDEWHGGNYNYCADMDRMLPIPGPPGSFLPSPGRMGSDELIQGGISSSLTTCWLPYSSENECEVAATNSVASNSIADGSTSASFTDMPVRPNHVVIRLMGKDLIVVVNGGDENFSPQKKAHGGDF